MAVTPLLRRIQTQIHDKIENHKRKSRLRGSKRSRSRQSRRQLRQLFAQSLEDRCVLASFTVSALGDSGAGTLRDAIAQANATAGPDTILFDSSVTGTITTTSVSGGEIEITDTLTIIGPGAGTLTVDAAASPADPFGVFSVTGDENDLTIQGLTISGGNNDSFAGGAINFATNGTLTIRNSVITGNQANNGGAIYSAYEGTISIEDSDVVNNRASYGAGGAIHNVSGNTVITNSNLNSNTSYGNGGAIASPYQGNITLNNVNLNDNSVTSDGYSGGALYSGEGALTITGSTITGNTSAGDGGALYSISGALQIENSTLENNSANYNGGAIFNELGDVTITDSNINENLSMYGDGAGLSTIAGNTTITRSTISGNRSVTDGGGISNVRGLVLIRDSTISGNTTGSDGGGVATNTGDVTIINSTISGNSANVRGGAVQTDSARVRLVNSTLVLNSASVSGGGVGTLIGVLSDDPDSQIFVHNSIIAQNTAPTSPDLSSPSDPVANLEVLSSLIGNNADSSLTASATPDANGNLIGSSASLIDPQLEALAANGGPVLTHAPLPSSPLIDAGNNSLALDFGADGAPGGGDDTTLETDGRGGLFVRVANAGGSATVDIGAIEVQPRPVLVVDSLEDENDGDFGVGDRSLREILLLANSDLGFDTILFAGGLSGTITLDQGLGSLLLTDTVNIVGPGANNLTITGAAGATHRLLDITDSAGDVALNGLTFSGGNAGTGEGGAIRSAATGDLVLRNVEIAGNTAANGGGIAVSAGALAIASSTVAENTSTVNGGAIYLSGSATGLQLVNATIADNSADGDGGGVYAEGGSIDLSSSTIAGNSATGQTGGVWTAGTTPQVVSAINSIVADNNATSSPDFNEPAGVTLTANASFVGNNEGTTLEASVANGVNSSGSFVGTALAPLDPNLAGLADNGGEVRTRAPESGSLVLDSGSQANLPLDLFDLDGDNNGNELLPVDARGATRVATALDMGAVELPPAPTLTWENPASIVFGTPLSETQLNASSNIPGTFAYTPAAGAVLNTGSHLLTAVFTPDNQLASRSETITVTIDVSAVDPVITWGNPAAIVFGTALDDTQLNATADVAGTFVYDPASGTVLDAGTHTLNVTFTPEDTTNFNEVTASVTIQVDQSVPVVVWEDPAGIIEGTALGDTQLNATADVAGTFVYTPAAGTVLGVGENQTLTVVFTPSDTNFSEVTATTMIDVIPAAEFDFGDAPSTYPVTLADDGARHEVSNLRLGANVDSEPDGTASPSADADTSDDGVTFLTTLVVPQSGQPVVVSAEVNVSEDGILDAWIDFNGDGDWDDPGEQIATSRDVTAGDNHLAFNVASDAVAGNTFARFRVSTAGGLAPTGSAADGEVEDYAVEIVAGNGANDVTVEHTGEQITVEVQNDMISVGEAGSLDTFYNGGVTEANRVIVSANASNNEFLVSPFAPLPSVQFDGGDGIDQLTLNGGDVDFTSDAVQANSIEIVQTAGPEAQSIAINDDAVTAMSDNGIITILGGDGDTLSLSDAGDWSIGDPTSVGSLFAIEITHNTSSNVIVSALFAQWQNPIAPSDVNGNGEITAGDALLIVNELGNRSFSDPDTQDLDDAATLVSFPGFFYDQNADGRVTALDALRIINELAVISASGEQFPGEGEGEWSSLVDALIGSAAESDQALLAAEVRRIVSFGTVNDSDDSSTTTVASPGVDDVSSAAIDELMSHVGALIES